eukprot:TRINITY_DN4496_c0_g1_i1.p1 TRINITY_DN4496_c0_g1~~TRINITY_DN4496_c0_g1_i1.p1  ORF type:complete len:1030 (-),score=176.63 TRINITY_DN4496_c0_g1_i1:568-3657(-)
MRVSTFIACFTLASWVVYSQDVRTSGHALLFNDDVIVKKNFNNFPTNQLTFEAWLSTSDYCHSGAILSYAIDSTSTDEAERVRDFNHFVIFDPKNLIACHDYEYIDLYPDYEHKSCHSSYNNSITTSYVERNGAWHHLAVTWDGQNNGNTRIYSNGMLVGEAMNTPTRPLQSGGALMLGAEQDCYGGCTDPHQGYYGLMDEVRIWKTVRTQAQIMESMRVSGDFNDRNLVAYWKFDDPDTNPDDWTSYEVAKDSSMYGNDLQLRTIPTVRDVSIEKNNMQLQTKAITFNNNYAIKPDFTSMPTKDFTIEFWARTGKLTDDTQDLNPREVPQFSEFISFATVSQGDGQVGNDNGGADTAFIDDAIRIERYLSEFQGSRYLSTAKVGTKGSISIHINANRQGNGKAFDNWLDFSTGWVDDGWHHVAVTWEYQTGNTRLYFDGEPVVPFWVSSEGNVDDRDPSAGGVDPHMGARVSRSSSGSLVLGQNQECFGGCFSPSKAYDGEMAVLRIWDKVLPGQTIKDNMMMERPHSSDGLKAAYYFGIQNQVTGGGEIPDEQGSQNLLLGADGPTAVYSSAPLTDMQGSILTMSSTATNYALKLHDKQVLMHPNFQNFPKSAITVEFWMKSVDACRMGVPFSYAAGAYESLDNSFLIFDYNNWGVAVMEEEGTSKDHNSGISATDGKWHYIAASWERETGRVRLYQDGRLVWVVQRSQGKQIPSGGTLVVGREQDCIGGCFDSASGAAGRTESDADIQYGAQDFYGEIDEMRVWNRELSPEQIRQLWEKDQSHNDGMTGSNEPAVNPSQDGLVAYWRFDEGKGYVVHDITNNGHHLFILEEPDWVVVSYEDSKRGSSVCGNGRVEGLEECDDGNRNDGDGCSADCKTEKGYYCTMVSPSVCVKSGELINDKYNKLRYDGGIELDKQMSTSNKSGSGSTVLVVVVILLVLLIAIVAVLYIKRAWVYDHFPGVERGVRGLQDKLGGFGNSKLNYHQYDVVALDPEQTNLSQDFAASSNVGPYAKLGGDVGMEKLSDLK